MPSRIPYDALRPKVDLIITEMQELTTMLTQLRDHDFGQDIEVQFTTDDGFIKPGPSPFPINPPQRPCEPAPFWAGPRPVNPPQRPCAGELVTLSWTESLEMSERLLAALLLSVRALRDQVDSGPA